MFFIIFSLLISLENNSWAATPSPVLTPSPSPVSSEVPVVSSIQGFCYIGTGATVANPGPCVNLLLVLLDDHMTEVQKSRTTSQGIFDFTADEGKIYHIVSGSKFYEVITPKAARGGEKINVQLQQK